VIAGYGSLVEVRDIWDIDTLFDSLEILDMKEEAEKNASKGA
jgi:hypothetical protein